jgi:ferric-dicitrate binding protein FerR (iron transport regulator)
MHLRRAAACLALLTLPVAAAETAPPLARVEIFRPGSILSAAPVRLRAGPALLGTLGEGERMVCHLALPAVIATEGTEGTVTGTSVRVSGGPALLRVALELGAVAYDGAAVRARFVARIEDARGLDPEQLAAERADAWREVPCAL